MKQIKKKRGRPRKEQSEIDNSDIRDDSEPKDIVNLFDMDEEKEDDIYVSSKVYKLVELVRKSDANTLREVERLLSAK